MAGGAETKERIVAATVALFARKGVVATTTKDIAAAAGIAEGTIYRHFTSKEALAEEIFLTNYLPFGEALDIIRRRDGAPRQKIMAMIDQFYSSFDRDQDLFTFLLIAQYGSIAKVPKGAPTPVTVLQEVIRQGIRAGAIRKCDPHLTTQMILGMILQPAVACVHGKLDGPLLALAPAITDGVWRMLAA